MLTPVDIQQKRFKTGIGFDKKDVTAFFEEVSRSYGELYKSNAELKERVITLTDQVQHYKIKEEDLNKTLLRAEKNSQESVTNAEKKANAIEMEAKVRGNEIVKEAKQEKDLLEEEIVRLQAEYTQYKADFDREIQDKEIVKYICFLQFSSKSLTQGEDIFYYAHRQHFLKFSLEHIIHQSRINFKHKYFYGVSDKMTKKFFSG